MTIAQVLWRTPGELTLPEQAAFQSLAEAVSAEFIPPLTTRSGTTQATLRGATNKKSGSYFDELLMQHNLLLTQADQLKGFLSFRTSHRDARLPQLGTCVYVSTIAILPAARGHGFARLLYEKLLALPETLPAWVLLRTWSTNTAHLGLLHSLNFELLLAVPDDRSLGVDTLYMATKRR